MHFFSSTLFGPLVVSHVRADAGFCRGVKPTVRWHVRFRGKKILERMNFRDWTDVQLASFLLRHLSCLIGREVKDWNWFNDIEVLFRFIASMTLRSSQYV